MEIFEQVVGAFMIGFVGGSVPGPVLTTAMAEALRKGFGGSLPIILKAMLSEVIIASFILLAFSILNVDKAVFYAISFIGAAVLIWFARDMWKIKDINGGGNIFSFKKIFLMMTCNGLFWIYWLTVCVPRAFLMSEAVMFGHLLFLSVFEFGWMISTIGVIFVFTRFRALFLKKDLILAVFKLFSILFLLFAARISWESIMFFYNH